ncbi:capsular polysaccharide export protein, LipB/KpsS family [Phenylobacterium montanum]|uniref:Uncharacterized protein n=1 Tax=Phenylobacterium montanum TaxID=2823693 RepID=A0A975G0Y1_9CAUL|nr:hypothetical protein [Caulobacter sp. S6]QUD89098.1 hypothetical protein KCG34_04210 [Caulobacter sp. S6]
MTKAIVGGRIGGEFWASSPSCAPAVRIAVRLERQSQLQGRLSFALELGRPDEILVLLPGGLWPGAVAGGLSARGFSVAIGPVDPWSVLERVQSVVVSGDDELGLLAILAGKSVYCRTGGYLGGWGATLDAPGVPSRGERRPWQIAEAVLIHGARYFNPFTGRVTDCESVVELLSDWRRIVDEDRDLACCAGIALWKRAQVKAFLSPKARSIPAYQSARRSVERAKRTGGAIAVWPSRAPAGLLDQARAAGVALRRVEDGFVRSVGLGSDLLPPCSIVIDRRGIYYDPSQPSDLEWILSETEFSADLRDRSRRLIDMLVARRLTKYNVGGSSYARPAHRRVVFVPGQVEDDQSWRLGGADCAGNLDLLRRVRRCEPDAFIVYKPHPDVEAGNRIGAVTDAEALQFADQVVRNVATPALLDNVDAVHVLTSLTGFEALLRGREVITHGQPFYSGWGLTRDLSPPPRRGRRLDLTELVAGTLILYPRYLDPVTRLNCRPEVLIDRLSEVRSPKFASAGAVRLLRQSFERVLGWNGKAWIHQPRVNHD